MGRYRGLSASSDQPPNDQVPRTATAIAAALPDSTTAQRRPMTSGVSGATGWKVVDVGGVSAAMRLEGPGFNRGGWAEGALPACYVP